jgi:Protein of unknown function (DUF2795)
MDFAAAAELKTLLTGVDLPADKAALLGFAVQQHAQPSRIAALRSLPQREFISLDDVAEELLHVHPVPPDDGVPSPHGERARRRRPQSA